LTRASRLRCASALPLALALAAVPADADELLPGLTAGEEEAALFVLGNSLFAMLRGLGRAVVDELGLEVEGRADMVADSFAVLFMAAGERDDLVDELSRAAADGWLMLAERHAGEAALWDGRPLDAERFGHTVCLFVGAGLKGFRRYGHAAGLDDVQIEACVEQHGHILAAWAQLLQPHLTDDAPSGIGVRFDVPEDAHQHLALFLGGTGVLDAAAAELAGALALPRDLEVAFMACDDLAPRWEPEAARVVVCYEQVALYEDLIAEDLLMR
jgi:hypothetical protein